MSDQELDDLFKNKLETLKRPPAPASWARVEQGVNRKNKRGVWFYTKIAAAILLLFTAGAVIIRSVSEENSSLLAINEGTEGLSKDTVTAGSGYHDNRPVKTDTSNEAEPVEPLSPPDPSGADDTEVLIAKHSEPMEKPEKTQHIPPKYSNTAKTDETVSGDMVIEETMVETLAEVTNNELSEETPLKIAQTDATDTVLPASTEKEAHTPGGGKTLVFDIEQFDTKVIVTSTSDGVSEEADKKGFKKIVDFVKNIKEGEGLAELREAKNNLFALNAKKNVDDNSK